MEANKPETTASILEEMRKGHTCNLPFAYMIGDGTPAVVDPIAREVEEPIFCLRKVTVGELADRLEQAIKREFGNVAAMREALSDACYAMFDFLKTQSGGCEDMARALDKAKAALASPPRNCDIGSAEEQSRRFATFCTMMDNCTRCPAQKRVDKGVICYVEWSQMPYEPTTEGDKA